jgi:hypothetical protein
MVGLNTVRDEWLEIIICNVYVSFSIIVIIIHISIPVQPLGPKFFMFNNTPVFIIFL